MKQFFILLSLCCSLFAKDSIANCSENNEQCTEIGRWDFSVAVGAGVATNPVRGGDNVPLVVLPYINYYGDKFFFDNTTAGYTFVEQNKFDVSVITQLNTEQAYFERFHPSNILVKNSFTGESSNPVITPEPGDSNPPTSQPDSDGVNSDGDSGVTDGDNDSNNDKEDPEPNEPAKSISLDTISKRDWALDGGILAHWYFENSSKLTLVWLHDVTNTYKGYHGSLDYSFVIPIQTDSPSRLKVKLGAEYKNKHLVDYYYGISLKDSQSQHHLYQGKATVNPYVGVAFNYKLNSNWQFKFSARHTWLGAGIKDSPLVDQSSSSNIFIGGLYEF
ncbi:MipA/OmpV family protein [Pseudoalteromonas luteoviolacea]|uniref:MipA/OmpV family protein n=1 Tax=Pseudoalteromonas luteoviolacea H33 TaxID=1365251 RepID=A0A166ZM87_9GAMM|nr:MipA/OmpV family protein [Pseudoalteromonas luteoviolacea]KZN44458.1 hypothetical protein N476_05535 [Pseudoalteromonas luteoviolacea H33]KZN78475.1 hypothetical protein N477_08725 [Pseudoalteromonas luteoviolacea H33-S]MBQ4878049.1 MipA/OmpV family protein [Pseudoalteromonas luteoviolacea]MBQ4907097.1 MipA/OmpV family protein [Pseudoalteromonas luteoviolacea]